MPDLCVDVIGKVISCRDAKLFGMIVFLLGSVFCFWYCFYLSVLQSPSSPRRDSPP